MITLFGVLTLPIYLACALSPDLLLILLFGSAVFGSAAVVIIGGFGVTPQITTAVLFIANVTLQLLLGRRFLIGRQALPLCMPLIAAAGYALLTAVAMPRIFDDQVLVYPQKQEAGAETVLLHFGAGNLTQSAYLVIAVLFCVCAAIFIAGRLTAMRRIFDAFLIAGLLSAGIAFWQLAAKLTGLPFPDDFLHSNTGWAQLSGQSLGFLPRINGSYSEPAALASYMCAYVYCAGWLLAQGCRHRLLLPVFAACLLALVISTSTTGYVVAAFGVVLLLLCVLRGRHPQVTARLLRAGLPVLAGVLVLAAVLPAAAPQVITAAAAVMTSTLDKGQSASYDDRTQADQDSLAMAAQTYGLGVGFGSNRPSSLVPSLLSNVGVLGLALFAVVGISLWRRGRRALRLGASPCQRMILQGQSAACLGHFLTNLVAGPMLSDPFFYLLIAMMIGTMVDIARSHRPAAPAAPPAWAAAPAAGRHVAGPLGTGPVVTGHSA